jgi:hypothetical protein
LDTALVDEGCNVYVCGLGDVGEDLIGFHELDLLLENLGVVDGKKSLD